ncbi:sugar lactone lactonase YvrE [Pseudorhizobium tarimense]|uniref:Sugar lactone lactonase YvrE n=1 Tax=Pseudorhizobium tarimense TaxID=1079109 RepID=A0ABV2H170_9HYPH|nr:SMP-30/gluconolactonase/LRE family protein [Pseudorhizobium tarimense]MCJ8517606.1 SMP-30/gluconolactonase/LRE family protein [Pseudorhizobium tarimense]
MSAMPHHDQVLSSTVCELGEGPSYEHETDTLWWLDILGKTLHELHLQSRTKREHPLPVMASVVARIDGSRQMMATEGGIFIRDRDSGDFSLYCELEPGKASNRSNDGRVHPSGSLWIGTMSKTGEDGAGAIYHVADGRVAELFGKISIPNSICFAPDGATGYFVDTRVNQLMRVPLDAATGLPVGAAEVLVDTSDRAGGMDGSVCDAQGNIWNARWGAGAVECFDPTGKLLAKHELPAKRTTCPVFCGRDFDRLAVTSAWEGMSAAERASDPLAGQLFTLPISVSGRAEPVFKA